MGESKDYIPISRCHSRQRVLINHGLICIDKRRIGEAERAESHLGGITRLPR
jgi:hypothetical protein